MANDNTQFFIKELAFEQALANLLHTSHGWDGGIMMLMIHDNTKLIDLRGGRGFPFIFCIADDPCLALFPPSALGA